MAYHSVIFKTSTTTRERRKQVPVVIGSGKGFTSVPDGHEELQFETSLDITGLYMMANKAASNKSGVCNDGPLRVSILRRKRLD